MSVNCSNMESILSYSIELHTVTFENKKDVVVRDCAGIEQFQCDVSEHAVVVDVSNCNDVH